jgi:hypothetical protein
MPKYLPSQLSRNSQIGVCRYVSLGVYYFGNVMTIETMFIRICLPMMPPPQLDRVSDMHLQSSR